MIFVTNTAVRAGGEPHSQKLTPKKKGNEGCYYLEFVRVNEVPRAVKKIKIFGKNWANSVKIFF